MSTTGDRGSSGGTESGLWGAAGLGSGAGLLGPGDADVEAEAGQDRGCGRRATGDVSDLGGQIAPGEQTILVVIDELVDQVALHLVEGTQRIGVDSRRGHASLLACADGQPHLPGALITSPLRGSTLFPRFTLVGDGWEFPVKAWRGLRIGLR